MPNELDSLTMDENDITKNYEQIRADRDWSFETLVGHLEQNRAARDLVEHFRAKTLSEAAEARSQESAPGDAPINPTPAQTRTAADTTPVQKSA